MQQRKKISERVLTANKNKSKNREIGANKVSPAANKVSKKIRNPVLKMQQSSVWKNL